MRDGGQSLGVQRLGSVRGPVGIYRINAFIGTREGSLWVANESGLHRFFQGAWVENGPEEGLPSEGIREVYADLRDWIGPDAPTG